MTMTIEQEPYREFGQAVRRERRALGLTVDQAAKRAGLGYVTFLKVEQGRDARELTFAKVDQLFGLPVGTARQVRDDRGDLRKAIDDARYDHQHSPPEHDCLPTPPHVTRQFEREREIEDKQQGESGPSRSQAIGRANNRRGKETERAVASYLRQWWPEARRRVATAWRTSEHMQRDQGDIAGTFGLAWQVKASKHLSESELEDALAETAEQAVVAGADYGILVQRRKSCADPARWWAWLSLGDVACLVTGAPMEPHEFGQQPCRTELRYLVPLLLRCGYGGQ